jgi:DNA modification methylase
VLDELRSEDIDLGNIGFSDEDLRRLLVGTFNSEDDIPAIPEESRTRLGDLVQLGHPAVSPVELPYRAIQAYTGSEAVVFEPFGGSGTTLIAAEKAGRKALVVERMPSYCDQIIRRWEMMTREEAKLLSNVAVDCSMVLGQTDSPTGRPPEQREGLGHESSVAG